MTTDDLITLIGQDESHRALDLVVIALRGLQALAENEGSASRVIDAARAIQQERPRVACLGNILDEFCQRLESDHDEDSVYGAVSRVCDALAADMIVRQDDIARQMAGLIGHGDTVMTHSMSSTISRVFYESGMQNKDVRAIITESRPACEGRLLAEDLSRMEIPTNFITESQIAIFMSRTDKVILGADKLLPDGSVVNKAGSFLVALAAHRFDVPLYVCAESFKQSQQQDPEYDEMAGDELEMPSLSSVTARNFYVEQVPSDLITRVITDKQ